MKKAPFPYNEPLRLQTLLEYRVLDTPEEEQFDCITKSASEIFKCEYALISFVSDNRQWFKSRVGVEQKSGPRDISFCGHTVLQNDIFIVEDAQKSKDFFDNPFVTTGPKIRFYAGAPLIAPNGSVIGTLCILDKNPKKLTHEERLILKSLANQVMTYMELRKKSYEQNNRINEIEFYKKGLDEHAIVAKTDKRGRIIYANDKFCEISKYSREELIGKDHRILNSQTHSKNFFEKLWNTILSGDPWHGEIMNRAKDGSFYWVDTTILPHTNSDGEITEFVSIRYDITEKKNVEIELKNRELKFAKIFEESLDAITAISPPDFGFVDCNPAALKLFGVETLEEFRKLGPWDLSPKYQPCGTPSAKKAEEVINKAMVSGHHFFEWTHLTLDKREVPVTILLTKIEENGKVILHAMLRDISEQKHLEKQLVQTNQHLNLALEGSGLGVWSIDLRTSKITFDLRSLQLLGLSEESCEVDINAWQEKVHPEDLDHLLKRLEIYLSGGEKFFEETYRIRSLEGSWKTMVARGRFTNFNSKGEPVRFTGTQQDITERVKQESEYQKQKALAHHQSKLASIGELAAGVGHEINNPLAIVKGYVSAIERSLKNGGTLTFEESKNKLENMNIAIKRIAEIVNGLRTFSRDEGESIAPFNPYEGLIESYKLIKDIFHSDNIELTLNNPLNISQIETMGNRGKFQQVLMNLLSNAKDATLHKDKPLIAINLDFKDDFFFISIVDNGKGIAESVQDKIFNPFFTTKDVNEGTGIGLSLAYKFIEEMKGELSFKNNQTQGTTFTIKLPAKQNAKEHSLKTSNGQNTEITQLKGRILLVEDEEGIRLLLSSFLEEVGLEVTTACDGEEAYHIYTDDPDSFDLIISDMKMPTMDGPTLLMALRCQSDIKQPKFLFMTGGINIDLENLDHQIEKMIDGYFLKPFNEDEVLALINKCLDSDAGVGAA
ncbi:MAG: PAS domain S-box protein [Bdellovibrionota bacterium]|nr:PAS domain S-box protein [Bdellovibrionota bacterium]